ncbi:hypothetical protein HRG_000911 [Hirsutella rhossiliensis]|uniref:Uncharacterized protein n=1 Tax=Hirsutella rhossiliensis TaxID=111463 RepID=A0A9P8SND4_9HYPO|nr:uncharacterized protein HRG_00911 [Hirsutella rhossiliensis]KAH0968269.1 hypothetical protein HRG_00911 [Hirsutella rhossiliensis]
MSSNGVLVAAEIHDFLQQVERARGTGFPLHSFESSGPLAARPGAYYAPSLMLSESRASVQPQRQQDMVSMASAATPMSAIFDTFDSYSTYSASTAPPQRGPEPPQRQRATVPDFAASWLPCEFHKLSGCEERFILDEVEAWIQHMMVVHLQGILPTFCICWFCDHAKFQAVTERPEDREVAYQARMRHIASHFFWDGKTAADVRWDFHFLDHAHDYGLITESVFRWATRQGEVRMPRGMTFDDPRTVRPAGEEQSERRPRHARPRDATRPSHVRRER